MLAEIHHKFSCSLEDELTGNFFGIMRYLPFTRGIKIIFEKCLKSDNPQLQIIIGEIDKDVFSFDFWKRSELGEIDAYMKIENVSIGIEVKYNSGLSGDNQLIREGNMLHEWEQSGSKLLLFIGKKESAEAIYRSNKQNLLDLVPLDFISHDLCHPHSFPVWDRSFVNLPRGGRVILTAVGVRLIHFINRAFYVSAGCRKPTFNIILDFLRFTRRNFSVIIHRYAMLNINAGIFVNVSVMSLWPFISAIPSMLHPFCRKTHAIFATPVQVEE